MALNNLGLGFTFTARDQASGPMGKLTRNFDKLDDRSGKVEQNMQATGTAVRNAGLGMVGVGALGAAALGKFAQVGSEFEQKLAGASQIMRLTKEQTEQLEAAAIKAGIEAEFDPTQALAAQQALGQQGLQFQEVLDTLTPSLDMAAASLGQLTPEETAGLAAQAMRAFSVPIGEVSNEMDKLAALTMTSAVQFRDLPLAMGVVSRGAGQMSQSLEESMIAFGLVKNVIPTLERSATATSVAMERMVKPETAKMLNKMGVEVANADGMFRNLLDVVNDMAVAMKDMTEEEAGAFLQKAFGEGSSGLMAMMNQLNNGITDMEGNLLKNADAVNYLRQSAQNAGGTMKNFAEAKLDTLAGQLTLLQGSISTFAVVVGKEVGRAFRPFVEGFLNRFNEVLQAFRELSPEAKKFLVGAAVVTTGLFLLSGAFLVVVGTIAAFKAAMVTAGVTMGGVLGLIAPAALAVAGLVAAFMLARKVIKDNIGGLGDAFTGAFEKVKLAFSAFSQLISQGFVESDTLKGLLDPANAGVLRFVQSILRVVDRVKAFGKAVMEGFQTALKAAEPAFTSLREGLGAVMAALGLAGDKSGEFATDSIDRYVELGRVIGEVVGKLVGAAAGFAAFAAKVFAIAAKITRFVAKMVMGILGVGLDLMVFFRRDVPAAFSAFVDYVKQIVQPLVDWFHAVFEGIKSSITSMLDLLADVASAIPESMRPQILDDFIASRGTARVAEAEAEAIPTSKPKSLAAAASTANEVATRGSLDVGAVRLDPSSIDMLADTIQGRRIEEIRKRAQQSFQLKIDGEKFGELIDRARNESAARGFGSTTPVEAE